MVKLHLKRELKFQIGINMNKTFEEVYKKIFEDEDKFWSNEETYPDECEVEDPIFEIIEEVGEKYKKTWEELAK